MHWKCPKIGVFGDFRGENWNIYLSESEPQMATPCSKARVATYPSPKSVQGLDQGTSPRNTNGGHVGFSIFFYFWAYCTFAPHAKFRNDRTYGSKVIGVFVFHRKCIESAPQLEFLAILGVKTEILIFQNPKRHLPVPKHAFWRIARQNRSTCLTGCDTNDHKK